MKFKHPLLHGTSSVAVDRRPQEFRKDQDKLLIVDVDRIGIERKGRHRNTVPGHIPVSEIKKRDQPRADDRIQILEHQFKPVIGLCAGDIGGDQIEQAVHSAVPEGDHLIDLLQDPEKRIKEEGACVSDVQDGPPGIH